LQQRLLGWLGQAVKNPTVWFLAALLALITAVHYGEQLHHPGFVVDLFSNLGLDRHAFERIVYLVPVIWAGFLLGHKGAFFTSVAALACMLPRAIFFSEYSVDAFFEASAVFIVGNVVAISFNALRKERQRRAQLEEAEATLQSQLWVIRENERRLAALNQVSAILSQSLELQQVLDMAAENVASVMQVDAAIIYLLDEEAEHLYLAANCGMPAEFTRSAGTIRIGEGLSGAVAETGEPLYVGDACKDSRLTGPESKIAVSHGIESLLSVPLKSKGRTMGTISVLMRSYRWFREDEVELLTAIASQVGVAIENARLYEKERLATQRLAASERNYRGLFENANDAIWVHDMEGNITVANKASERQTGYTQEELVGMNVREMLDEEGLHLAAQVKDKLLENEPLEQPYEQRIIRKDGTEAFLMLTTNLVVENGVPVGFQNISRDVTEEKRMRENLNFYLGEVTKAQEEERTRIARELHDDTIQALVVIARQLDELATSTKGISEEKRVALERLWQQTNDAIQGVRRMSQDLRPPTLDRLGLVPALERLVADVTDYSNIPIKATVIGTGRRLSQDAELMLFRIAQEALRNVWKHAQATEAELVVEFDETRVRISVSDNGKGFEVPGSVGELTREGKLGLTGMQERVRLLGGTLKVETAPGKGTTVTVEAPV